MIKELQLSLSMCGRLVSELPEKPKSSDCQVLSQPSRSASVASLDSTNCNSGLAESLVVKSVIQRADYDFLHWDSGAGHRKGERMGVQIGFWGI